MQQMQGLLLVTSGSAVRVQLVSFLKMRRSEVDARVVVNPAGVPSFCENIAACWRLFERSGVESLPVA